MTKDLEKLSAWYDGEISKEDFDKFLEKIPYMLVLLFHTRYLQLNRPLLSSICLMTVPLYFLFN